MKTPSVWNIVFTVRKSKIYLNASVFFFFVIPFVCYAKYTSQSGIKFLLTYGAVLLAWYLYKIIYYIIKQEDIRLFPFGVTLFKQKTDIYYDKVDKVLTFIVEPIFTLTASYFIYTNNFFPSATIFPLMLLSFSLMFFLRDLHIISYQNTLLTLSIIYLYIAMFSSKPEFLVFFVSFLYYTFSARTALSLDDIGDQYFVRNIMTNKDYLKVLSPTDSVEDIIDDIVKLSQKFFPVIINNKIVGITRKEEIMLQFKTSVVGDYPLVGEFMTKVEDGVSPDDNIKKAKEVFDEGKIDSFCLPVIKDGKFLGLLIYEFFIEFISIKKFLYKFKI